MINNKIYRDSLLRVINTVDVRDKCFLITGASGLIGSCLIDLLMLANDLGHNNKVWALGRSCAKLKERFSFYFENPNFNIIEQDICSPISTSYRFDYIIHCASNADPISYSRYPVETITTNVLGTNNILEYGRMNLNCRIVCLSTFEVYGNACKDVYSEHDFGLIDFNTVRASYPESKRVLEILCKCYYYEYGVNVSIARLSSVYGPTMLNNDSKAHAQFLKDAVSGNNIVLKSKGLQRRTYTYVVDVITALLCVLFRGKVTEAYNISNDNSIASIMDVAKTCAYIAGTDIIYEDPSMLEKKGFSQPQNCILDNSKLKQLGWNANYPLNEGLLECYQILKSI